MTTPVMQALTVDPQGERHTCGPILQHVKASCGSQSSRTHALQLCFLKRSSTMSNIDRMSFVISSQHRWRAEAHKFDIVSGPKPNVFKTIHGRLKRHSQRKLHKKRGYVEPLFLYARLSSIAALAGILNSNPRASKADSRTCCERNDGALSREPFADL